MKKKYQPEPPPKAAPLPEQFYFIAVTGRPRRPETFRSQAAAEKAAKSLARLDVLRTVGVFRAEPLTAFRDEGL
jgi:hypothetical protein